MRLSIICLTEKFIRNSHLHRKPIYKEGLKFLGKGAAGLGLFLGYFWLFISPTPDMFFDLYRLNPKFEAFIHSHGIYTYDLNLRKQTKRVEGDAKIVASLQAQAGMPWEQAYLPPGD